MFLARVLADHYAAAKDNDKLENVIPQAPVFAICLRGFYNSFESEQDQDRKVQDLFILEELLKLGVHVDYADPVGRTKTSRAVGEY